VPEDTTQAESPTEQAESPAGAVESQASAAEWSTGEVESPPSAVDSPTGDVESSVGAVESPASAVKSPTGAAESPASTADSSASAAGAPVAQPAAAAEPAGRAGAGQQWVMPAKLVFRTPGSAYVAIVFVLMCASFVAVASPWYTLVYLLPLGAALWVLRTRTEIDADKLVIRRVLTRTVLPWSKVASFRLTDRRWIRAVRTDGGGEIPLPSVRTRHLPALALISGGRVTDPTDPDLDQGPV
jgi:hypothetical protein